MGVFDLFRRGGKVTAESKNIEETALSENKKTQNTGVVVGAGNENDAHQVQSFDNSNITFSGEIATFDQNSILRDKQGNIINIYKLADYYTDADPIIRGAVKQVFVPQAVCSPWVLKSGKDKTVKLYEKHYAKMRLREKLEGIALEYFKYSNVFCYLLDGQLVTLPVHKCRIGNVALNGKPIVDFDCQSIVNEWKYKGYDVKEESFKDSLIEEGYKGYPEEIKKAIKAGHQQAQLNPENTFVLQAPKESWQRYAVPFIAACLKALSKKELISSYETAVLNLGIRSFVHVKYGDEKKGADMLPDGEQLRAVRGLFQKAMSGFPLVVTNQLATAEVIQPKLDDLFQFPKYETVNTDILSACGVGSIMVNGASEDGSTFASAQMSTSTVGARIEAFRSEFEDMMNRVNERLVEYIDGTYNLKETPTFSFMPMDMNGKKALRESCRALWDLGLVSTKTLMETNGYSLDVERAQREKEIGDGTDDVMRPRDEVASGEADESGGAADSKDAKDGKETRGRKTMDDDERHSDPDAAQRGKMPKPSNKEGSGDFKQ